jgi:hypothetical protein
VNRTAAFVRAAVKKKTARRLDIPAIVRQFGGVIGFSQASIGWAGRSGRDG